jgi:hypothetical protein
MSMSVRSIVQYTPNLREFLQYRGVLATLTRVEIERATVEKENVFFGCLENEKVCRFPSYRSVSCSTTLIISIPTLFTHNLNSDINFTVSNIFATSTNHDVLYQHFPILPRASGCLQRRDFR